MNGGKKKIRSVWDMIIIMNWGRYKYDLINNFFRRQIKEKEENSNQLKRETLEEGRKLKQKQESELNRLEKIKETKISNLKNLEINSKYVSDLERYKIK